jgi:cytochrome c oxidase subunit 4
MGQKADTPPQHVVSLGTNIGVFIALLVLLALTIGVARLNLGMFNIIIALTIASCKALLIILYFMHVRYSNRLAWVIAGAGFIWLAILISLTMSDYISRGWFGVPPPPLGSSGAMISTIIARCINS